MASTGLDIPTLNGLILATPRSDIVQSIGRIDRIVHSGIQPLIIDYCDMFSSFKTQSYKRFCLFKKKRYIIEDNELDFDKNREKTIKKYDFHKKASIENTEDSDEEKKEMDVDAEGDDIDYFDHFDTFQEYNDEKKLIKPKKDKMIKKNIGNTDDVLLKLITRF
jgi:hypothetical protein